MADLYFALFCKQNRIPLVAVSRPDAWLLSLPGSEADSLYEEFRHDDSAQAAVVRAHRPWGYAAVRDAVAGVRRRQPGSKAVDRLTALLPCGRACAS